MRPDGRKIATRGRSASLQEISMGMRLWGEWGGWWLVVGVHILVIGLVGFVVGLG